MTQLTLKDIPVEFLTKQDSSFFQSQSYLDAVSLFNSIKVNTPLIAPITINSVSDIAIIFKNKLIDNYLTGEFTFNTSDEQLTLLYIKLVGINMKIKSNKVLLQEMNISTLDVPTTFRVGFKRVFKSVTKLTTIEKFKRTKVVVTVPPSAQFPTKTNNPIQDITDSVKFFRSNSSPLVFDREKFNVKLFNEFIKQAILFNSNNYGTVSNDTPIATHNEKPIFKSDLVAFLQELLILKYTQTYTENTTNELITDDQDIVSSIIKNLNIKPVKYNFLVYNFVQEVSDTVWIVDHNLDIPVPYTKLKTIIKANNSVLLNPTVVETTNSITLTLPSTDSGICTLLLDSSGTFDSIKNYFNYQPDGKTFKFTFFNTNTYEVFCEGMDEGFLYEVYLNNNIVVIPSSIVITSKNTVVFTFSSNITGKIFIMPANRFDTTTNTIFITEKNLDAICSMIDNDKEYRHV